MLWRLIDNPKEGELVTYVGVHAVNWRPIFLATGMTPDVAFAEADPATDRPLLDEMAGALRKPCNRDCDNGTIVTLRGMGRASGSPCPDCEARRAALTRAGYNQ